MSTQAEPDQHAAVTAGARWMSASQAVIQAIRMLVYVLLARLLAPEDFGLLVDGMLEAGAVVHVVATEVRSPVRDLVWSPLDHHRVLSILHNRAIDHLRSMASRRRTQEKLEAEAPRSQPSEAFTQSWRDTQRERVREALGALPPEQLKIVELREQLTVQPGRSRPFVFALSEYSPPRD
jgi:hypothetical protein